MAIRSKTGLPFLVPLPVPERKQGQIWASPQKAPESGPEDNPPHFSFCWGAHLPPALPTSPVPSGTAARCLPPLPLLLAAALHPTISYGKGGPLSKIWVKGERVQGRSRGGGSGTDTPAATSGTAQPRAGFFGAQTHAFWCRVGGSSGYTCGTPTASQDRGPLAGILSCSHVLTPSTCFHACASAHTQARRDVGHWLQGLGAGGYEDLATRHTLPDWTESHPSCLPPPPRLACIHLTQSLSRLPFIFP